MHPVTGKRDLRLDLEDAMSGGELDALLGIYQRGTFDRHLQELTRQSVETGNPLGLVMSDIDKFKRVNDTYGHRSGDEVLQFVASTCKKTVAGKGKAYRYGGEELAMLLPNYNAEEAATLAERIRKEIAAESISAKAIRATVSFGVAELSRHATTAEELVEAADTALYAAKKLGRNLVRISGELQSVQRERIVSRRQPDPSVLTDDEVDKILSEHFRYYNAFCPRDGSKLDVLEHRSDERVTVDLSISCPRCGLKARIDAPS
jgi:diguanylate cyclase (GGDEF)-like protein